MYGVILLLVVATLSLLITRVATIALTATGMTRVAPTSRLGGFTTTESEEGGPLHRPRRA